jgi:REP element-mobilizing transposase RayT
MSENLFSKNRNSKMDLHKVYFWTSSIKDWKKVLSPDKYKLLIINNLTSLVNKGLITIYAYVIMPNHIHIVWQMNGLNGKEMPHASFNKATAHLLVQDLKIGHPKVLDYFKVKESERRYRIWQRDPLAVFMDNKPKNRAKNTIYS